MIHFTSSTARHAAVSILAIFLLLGVTGAPCAAEPGDMAQARITDDRQAVTKAVKIISPAVVNIDTKVYRKSDRDSTNRMERFFREFFGDEVPFRAYPTQEAPRQATGSGVILSPDGLILTNDHVVRGAHEIIVTLSNKKQYKGTLKGSDRVSDIAIVKIDAAGLPVARLGDSDRVEVGEWVLAVGNPYGYDNTVTVGVISGRKRHLTDGASDYPDLLQTDAAINPGNSGGPLVNLDGQVIGINTAIIPFAQGIGFAIPVNVVKNIQAQLQSKGKVVRPYLGVYLQDFTQALADYMRVPFKEGVLITGVMQGSPAEKGGVKKGDVVEEIDNIKVKTAEEFRKSVQQHGVGDRVKLLVWSSGKQEVLSVTVGEMP